MTRSDNSRQEAINRLAKADIYGITADRFYPGRGNVETVRFMLAAGIKVIQYREKAKKARQMYEECLQIRNMTWQADSILIINDYTDLALAVQADGVHIGQDDLPPDKVRQIVGTNMLLGLSTHSPFQARFAESSGIVDYIGVGPIFSTDTKKDVCAPVGLQYINYVTNNVKIPFVAIGGIKEHNISQVIAAGAKTVSLVTEIVAAPDIEKKVKALRTIMGKVSGS